MWCVNSKNSYTHVECQKVLLYQSFRNWLHVKLVNCQDSQWHITKSSSLKKILFGFLELIVWKFWKEFGKSTTTKSNILEMVYYETLIYVPEYDSPMIYQSAWPFYDKLLMTHKHWLQIFYPWIAWTTLIASDKWIWLHRICPFSSKRRPCCQTLWIVPRHVSWLGSMLKWKTFMNACMLKEIPNKSYYTLMVKLLCIVL